MKYEVRELSLGEVLDQTVKVLQNNFGLLFGIVACLQLPIAILTGILLALMVPNLGENPTTMEEAQQAQAEALAAIPLILGISLLSLIAFPITQGAIIHGVSKAYLSEKVTIGDCFGKAFQRLIPLVLTWFLVYICVVLGIFLCIVPGIIFGLWFGLVGPIVVMESTSGPDAMTRSKHLMKGSMGNLFVLGLLIGVINWIVGFGSAFIPSVMVQQLFSQIVGSVLILFGSTATVIFYFSCRSKVENFDLNILAGSFGKSGMGGQPQPQQPVSYDPNNPYANPNNPYQQQPNYDQGNAFQQPQNPNPPNPNPPNSNPPNPYQ